MRSHFTLLKLENLLGMRFQSSKLAILLAAITLTPAWAIDLQQYALRNAGDVENGKKLFADKVKTKCALCHRIGEEGGLVGPELSSIGGKFDRPHLIESLLEPSRQIVEGYRTSSLLTVDGQVIRGLVKLRTESAVTIVDVDAKEHRIATSDIDEIRDDTQSIMPAGLADALTADEFTDLVAYLESLRSGGTSGAGHDISGPLQLPVGFDVETIATGLSGATALETLPDGRVFVCEQTGTIRVIENGQLLAEPLLTLDVNHEWERGVIGVTVDPAFPVKPFVYVCWTGKTPYPHHRISRFEVDGNRADMESELVLLEGDDQSKMGGQVPAGHQGGALHFGIDGKLYMGIGEQTAGSPAQELNTFLGKMLRINSDGRIPADNPLRNMTEGKYQAIWTTGMRNPFTFAVRQSDGLILINDVGGKFEEINIGKAGRNYGWPTIPHGLAGDDQYEDPIHRYPEASISGGDFLEPAIAKAGNWPQAYTNQYFFADFKHGWIHSIAPDTNSTDSVDPATGRPAQEFAVGLRRPVDLRFSGDGKLYVLLRNAWVIDGKFEGGTSSLLAIKPQP